MTSALSVVIGQDSVDYSVNLRCGFFRGFRLPGSLSVASDRAFRRTNLPGIWRDRTWSQVPLEQIEDRPQLSLGLVNLGVVGLELGVDLVRLVELLLEGDGLGLGLVSLELEEGDLFIGGL